MSICQKMFQKERRSRFSIDINMDVIYIFKHVTVPWSKVLLGDEKILKMQFNIERQALLSPVTESKCVVIQFRQSQSKLGINTHFCWHFMVAWRRQRRQATVVLDPTVFPGRQDVEGQRQTLLMKTKYVRHICRLYLSNGIFLNSDSRT